MTFQRQVTVRINDVYNLVTNKSNYDSSLRNAQNNRGVFKFPKNVERVEYFVGPD
jgi:hypothetical protein